MKYDFLKYSQNGPTITHSLLSRRILANVTLVLSGSLSISDFFAIFQADFFWSQVKNASSSRVYFAPLELSKDERERRRGRKKAQTPSAAAPPPSEEPPPTPGSDQLWQFGYSPHWLGTVVHYTWVAYILCVHLLAWLTILSFYLVVPMVWFTNGALNLKYVYQRWMGVVEIRIASMTNS